MKKTILPVLLSILALLQPAFAATAAKTSFQKIIILTPGQESEARFYLTGVFDGTTLSPTAIFPVLLLGYSGTLSAELTIDPEDDLDLAFTDEIKGMLLGAAFSTAHPFAYKAGQSIDLPVEAIFGFALIGAVITTIDTQESLDEDIPCSITVTLTEQESESQARHTP